MGVDCVYCVLYKWTTIILEPIFFWSCQLLLCFLYTILVFCWKKLFSFDDIRVFYAEQFIYLSATLWLVANINLADFVVEC